MITSSLVQRFFHGFSPSKRRWMPKGIDVACSGPGIGGSLRRMGFEQESAAKFKAAMSLIDQAKIAEFRAQNLEAVNFLRAAMNEYPYLPSQWGKIAKLLILAGQTNAAIEAAGNELEIRPDNTEALAIVVTNQTHLSPANFGSEDGPKLRIVNQLCERINQQARMQQASRS